MPTFQNEANWSEDARNTVSAHFNHLQILNEQGLVIFAGKTDYSVDNESNFGVVVFKANDENEAKEIMKSDPAIKERVMKAELHPFSVALIPV